MNEHTQTHTYIAKTFFGLEPVLSDELKNIGATQIKMLNRAVSFSASEEIMYKANLWLRTALRIIKPIHEFKAINEEQLYRHTQKMDWSQFLEPKDTFVIDSTAHSKFLTHSHYAALKVKDAIVDQLRDQFGERPSIDAENPTLRINLHIAHDDVTIGLDASGNSLHKRGYRTGTNEAPLNEILAAGMILLSGWDRRAPLLDPMCGSGTIPIEAAMIALNVPPGHLRTSFGFFTWKDFDPTVWKKVRTDAETQRVRNSDVRIFGSDIDRGILDKTRQNIVNAKMDAHISIAPKSFSDVTPPATPGMIITNPPYGERLKPADLQTLYKMIGDVLKKNFTGWDAWVISGNKDALKQLGLHPSKKLTLYNGALECRFQKFAMYRGSIKQKHQTPNDEK
ncbi:MAG TPA: THUMP domain-containing protein [bacterium]|nr:THUMP domain-containing protein [bacterium]